MYSHPKNATLDELTCDNIGTWLVDVRENERMIDDSAALPPVSNIDDVNAILSSACKITSTLGEHVGWKCGATNKPAYTKFGLQEPFRAPLHRYRVFQQNVTPVVIPSVLQKNLIKFEAEFAFILNKPLPPKSTPYTDEEIWKAVRIVVPAIEVIGTRWTKKVFQQATMLQKIVDFGINECCALGTEGVAATSCRRDLNNAKVEFLINGKVVLTGKGDAVLDHPIKSLKWLANDLNKSGICTRTHVYGGGAEAGLLAGDIVMSGAALNLDGDLVKPGDIVTARFESLGDVSVVRGEPSSKM
tara:strand:- start:71 stop:973 length:903 start_codon:yes stop_codon:yes gene_type:complete